MNIEIFRPGAKPPTRGTPSSAGLDLYAANGAIIPPGERQLIGAGIAIELPPGTVGYVKPRSGLALHCGIDVLGGVIDADYRGEVGVILLNTSTKHTFQVHPGDRIAQLVVHRVEMMDPVVVHELGGSERKGGFGSTGR